MRVRKWRALIGAAVAAVAVAAGAVTLATTANAEVSDGAVLKIVAKSDDGKRILVLDAGRLVGAGTHAELIALGGRYARLYAIQATAYAMS